MASIGVMSDEHSCFMLEGGLIAFADQVSGACDAAGYAPAKGQAAVSAALQAAEDRLQEKSSPDKAQLQASREAEILPDPPLGGVVGAFVRQLYLTAEPAAASGGGGRPGRGKGKGSGPAKRSAGKGAKKGGKARAPPDVPGGGGGDDSQPNSDDSQPDSDDEGEEGEEGDGEESDIDSDDPQPPPKRKEEIR